LRVLIIEDDEAISEAIASLLEDSGYSPIRAADGRGGLEALRSGTRPSLILLDMAMPGMNGWRFREEQMKDPGLAEIPVVVFTADTRAEERARELGAAGWLRKPVDPARLLSTIEKHCGRHPEP
jgi:CheY-like chemotaxis protein